MIIKGFWHIYLINHWYTIVTDQLRIILTSGLYENVSEISIGCLGNEEQKVLLEKLIINLYPKLKIKYYSDDPTKYEFPTLKLIEMDKGDYIGFYFHTKAVTKPDLTIINHWRAWLNETILNQWKLHYNNIECGYDVSSVNHCIPPLHPEHFSGNFWWFNRKYIDRLPKIDSLNHSYRWSAEQWICKGKGRFYSGRLMEPGRDVFKMKH